MTSMGPGQGLTQPGVQAIVEGGVHNVQWYLSLESWLLLLLSNLQNHLTATNLPTWNQLLSVN